MPESIHVDRPVRKPAARKNGEENDYGYGNESSPSGDGAAWPQGSGNCRTRREVHVALVHARLSAGGKKRTRRDGGRRGRQCFLGLCRRNRCVLDRALPSEGGFGDSEAGRGTDTHVGHGFLVRELAVFGGKARQDRA